MIRLALRSLFSRPLRTVLTTLAIVLGVAMISGTYVLTDQITNGFDDIFTTAYKGTAVVVVPKSQIGGFDDLSANLTMPESLLAKAQAVDGVGSAAGNAETAGAVLVDGKVVTTGGAPTLIMSADDIGASNVSWTAGGPPTATSEVVVDSGFAEKHHVAVGDQIAVATQRGTVPVTVSGVFTYGDNTSLGGTIMVGARLADVQQWFAMEGRLTSISMTAQPSVTPARLAARVRAALPDTVDVKTGTQAAAESSSQIGSAVDSFLRPALLAFGGVAVFVGAFIIFNAFSITVAQRRREFAMLRAFGACRRQVLGSVVGEALLVGFLASVTGLFAGLGVAKLVSALLKAFGADFPAAGLALEPRTVVVAVAVGVGTVLAAAVVPALRATRVPPVAALQEGAELPASRLSRLSARGAAVVALAGAGLVTLGFFAGGSTGSRLLEMGLGAMLLFIAIAMVSRYMVRPLARVIGWPLERLGGTAGRLARDNASRNPARTANTAAALMIGLGLVVFVAVFAQGMKASFTGVLDKAIAADVVVMDTSGTQALPADGIAAMRDVPGVQTVAGAAFAQAKLGHRAPTWLTGIDAEDWSTVWHFDWRGDADDALLKRLGDRGAVVEERYAKGHGISVGDIVTVTAPNGRSADVSILGLYHDPFSPAFSRTRTSGVTVSSSLFDRLGLPMDMEVTMARGVPGTDPDKLKVAVEKALVDYPTQTADTQGGYKDGITGQIDMLLSMLYALLAMSVIISVFGIVNTLVLSVYERTREIGMLRAIGASRRQLRRMVRYESVITSAIGGVLGVAVGTAFAYVVTTRYAQDGFVFDVPYLQLVVFLVVSVMVGVAAAVLPARRAARTDILEAIHHE
jgi:putative ABC transport system permease protein